jgi:hypothetical protein
MKRNYINHFCLLLIITILSVSCEYYLGINQQPEFQNSNRVEGLNIFGLIRPDSRGSFNKSFVFVQQIWPALDMDSFSIINNASIQVERIINDTIQSAVTFPLVPSDSLFSDTLYRPVADFSPLPGERYRLVCKVEGLPDAIGETVCPPPPVIIENSLVVNGSEISFSIATDTLISMYDIIQVGITGSELLARIIPSSDPILEVVLALQGDTEGIELKIFGYDTHLAAYYGNSNTSLNFNKYRTIVTTLESGYGVFGSLNFTSIVP